MQKPTVDYLKDHLGWKSVYAYNRKTFSTDGFLGRDSDREVVLKRYLHQALEKLNPRLPETVYEEARERLD